MIAGHIVVQELDTYSVSIYKDDEIIKTHQGVSSKYKFGKK